MIPDVYVLSARFGLIPGDQPVPHYDRRMTVARAQDLHDDVISQLAKLLATTLYKEAFICAGKDYRAALDGYESLLPVDAVVYVTTGSLGRQLAALHDWLHGRPPGARANGSLAATGKAIRLRGVEVTASALQVLHTAREELEKDGNGARRYEAWYVPIDGVRVAPKWLISQITGLPVSGFSTDEARRVLGQLGIEVRRA